MPKDLPFRTRFRRALIFVAIVPMLFFTLLVTGLGFVTIKDRAHELEREIAHHVSTTTVQFLTESLTWVVAVDRGFNLLGHPRERQQLVLSQILSNAPALQALALVDLEGEIIGFADRTSVSPDSNWLAPSTTRLIEQAAQGTSTVLSPADTYTPSGQVRMWAAHPLADLRHGGVAAVIVAEIRGDELDILTYRTQHQSAGDKYIVNPNGRLVSHPNSSMVLKGSHLDQPSREGIRRGISGGLVILASHRFDVMGREFVAVAERDLWVAAKPAIVFGVLVIVFLVLTVALASTLAARTATETAAPIEKIARTAVSFGQGDFLQRTQVRGQDEVGRLGKTFDQMANRVGELMRDLEHEIFEKESAQVVLKEQGRFLDSIVENLPLVVFVKNVIDFRYLQINRAGETLLGRPKAEIVGKTDYDIFPREIADFFRVRDYELLATDQMVDIPDARIDGAQGPRTLHIRKICIRTETGDPAYILGIIEDVTERREVEEQLRQAQKMEAVGQLTGGVAHDFNNLLGIILGNAEMLEGDEDLHPVVAPIIRATERGAELTQRLLAFSRQQPLSPEAIDMCGVVRGVADLLPRVLGATIEVVLEIPDDLPHALADAGQVENALLNLALNARDAMPFGGKLTFAGKAVDPVDLTAAQLDLEPGAYVAVTVTDEGDGMSEETVNRAFEPFFTTKETGEGSGLGLAMVYGFAKQSGGLATISSAPGSGTTVTLYLPRARADAVASSAGLQEEVRQGNGECILVIEDDPDLRAVVGELLSRLGYRAIRVADARAASDMMDKHPEIALVLTDIVLPGDRSGPDFIEDLRARQPDLKAIFMSGHSPDVAALRRPGLVDTLLLKPFREAQLATALRMLLD